MDEAAGREDPSETDAARTWLLHVLKGRTIATITSGYAQDRVFRLDGRYALRWRKIYAWVYPLTEKSSQKPASSRDDSHIEIEGKVIAVLPGTMFRVQLSNGHIVLAHISGKLRKRFIRIAAGDTVKMEMSPYDMDKARITFRVRDNASGPRPPPRRRR
jgi:translation initiation factor IF-1